MALGAHSVTGAADTVSVGAPSNERRVANVADAIDATDAVNLGQLSASAAAINQRLASVLGGGAAFDPTTGAFTGPSFNVQGASFNTVAGALGAVDSQVTTNTGGIATLHNRVTTNEGDIVDIDNRMTTNEGDIVDLDNRVTTNAGDIVNLDNRVTTNEGDIVDLRSGIADGTIGLVRRDAATCDISVGAAVGGSLFAISGTAGDRRLTGVAAGVSAGDAVNVAQLNAAVATTIGGIPVAGNNASGLPAPSATGTDTLAAGFGAQASGTNSAALGSGAQGSGDGSVAVDAASVASAAGAVAMGQGADASAPQAVAMGDRAVAAGSTAVGGGAQATGADSAAYGRNAVASGDRSTAVGENSVASGSGSIAVGEGAQATHASSVAVGAGARASRANQVVMGSGTYTYTMPGIASSASRAAQSGPLEVVTADRSGNLATDGGATFARLDSHERRLDKGMEGAALAVALQTPLVPSDRRFAMSGGWGHFEGENGLAFTGAMRLNRNVQLEGGLGLGVSHSTFAGRAGATVTW